MDKLERKSAADLPPTRQELPCGLAEVAVQVVGVHILQVYAVEQVVELKPDLEIKSLLEPVVLVNGRVRLGEVRSAESVLLLVAFGSQSRCVNCVAGLENTPFRNADRDVPCW